MSKNFISYTNLSYDTILDSIKTRIGQDSRFVNYSQSSMYAMLSEIFAATTDFTNFYLERRAEESYLDSAKLRSSIVSLSRMLGYVIRRPIPAKTQIKITIKKLPQSASTSTRLLFNKFTPFVMGPLDFILPTELFYEVTQEDINNFNAIPNYYKELNYFSSAESSYGQLFADNEFVNEFDKTPITLIQGVKTSYTINGNANNQVNTRFQKYIIPDKTFSNIYGNEVYGYNSVTGETTIENNITKVTVGVEKFFVDRKTLMTQDSLDNNNEFGDGKDLNYCILRTNIDDSVELCFGDDVVSSIGARSASDNIVIEYFSTKGAEANTPNVVGRSVDIQVPTMGDFDKSQVVFNLTKNIVGGADVEDLESIKINAPSNYATMDRCVTIKDYVSYLKALTFNGDNIKNAIAWGEQEESKENGIANIKLFNVVLFTFLVDLYKKSGSRYIGLKTNDDIGIDNMSASTDYFNIIVKSDSVTPIIGQSQIELPTDLQNIYKKLYNRSEISVKNVYIAPTVRDFVISGNVYMNPLVDKIEVSSKVNDAIYSYLSNNMDYRTPLYISNLIDVIETFPEIKYADIKLASTSNYDIEYFSTVTSDCIDIEDDIPSGAPISGIQWFTNNEIGYVFKSSVTNSSTAKNREYSVDLKKDIVDVYISSIINILQNSGSTYTYTYNPNTLRVISNNMPKMEMKLTKVSDENAQYTLVWPDMYNGISFPPSERNVLIGMMKNTYETLLKMVSSKVDASDVSNVRIDNLVSNDPNCNCCLRSLVEVFDSSLTTEDINGIKYFLDNDFIYVVKAFVKNFTKEINESMLDGFGNIINYSMRNEIVRVEAPTINQYIFR
jgi:hypothetical protein